MKFDTRNPFAAWGFEEEKYAVNANAVDGFIEFEGAGFVNPTTEYEESYNVVAEPIDAETYANTVAGEAFFTNNEVMLPTELQTKAYGINSTGGRIQPVYPAGENLNYYGIQADDLMIKNTVVGEATNDDNGDNGGEG